MSRPVLPRYAVEVSEGLRGMSTSSGPPMRTRPALWAGDARPSLDRFYALSDHLCGLFEFDLVPHFKLVPAPSSVPRLVASRGLIGQVDTCPPAKGCHCGGSSSGSPQKFWRLRCTFHFVSGDPHPRAADALTSNPVGVIATAITRPPMVVCLEPRSRRVALWTASMQASRTQRTV